MTINLICQNLVKTCKTVDYYYKFGFYLIYHHCFELFRQNNGSLNLFMRFFNIIIIIFIFIDTLHLGHYIAFFDPMVGIGEKREAADYLFCNYEMSLFYCINQDKLIS